MKFSRTNSNCVAVVALAAVVAASLSGCERRRTMTAEELKQEYAAMILEGGSQRFTVVKAGSYDPETYDLLDVRIEDGKRMIHAERAEILVDVESGSISLRLIDVVGTHTEGGELISIPGFTTERIKLRNRVVDGQDR
ncbi:MAG: hypothetical protein EA376_05330 [Phycisphaeraceae bacterium]|nr:MAG: hypothetical protein EA376_05330 [Phycisphaeraceae bacterium]